MVSPHPGGPAIDTTDPLSTWLQRGGDHRLVLDPETGLSGYRVGVTPRSSVPLGSCTASSPSPGGVEAAQTALDGLNAAADWEIAVESLYEGQRERLAQLFELSEEHRTALLPSGTDAVYLVSCLGLTRGRPVHHVVVGAAELGGGTVKACTGHVISGMPPHGESTLDAPMPGLAEHCSAEPLYLRRPNGERREPTEVDEQVRERVRLMAQDHTVVLHLVAHS